jgi:uncharacterized protein YecT (DUF1311 family)
MAYLRLSTASNDNWEARPADAPAPDTWGQRRYGVMPPHRRRRGGHLLAGLVAMPLGVWGLWLLLGAPTPAADPGFAGRATRLGAPLETLAEAFSGPREPRPLVFQVEHARPGLTIEVAADPPPETHPETWGALPTAVTAPVVATPLADPSLSPEEIVDCRKASTLAAQMTCIDPTLRDADRRMAASYEAVLAAGVPPSDLGRSQARWLATRDEAARTSPEDLLAAYQLRENQLRGLALAWTQRAGSVGVATPASAMPVVFGSAPRPPTSNETKPDERSETSRPRA